MNPGIGFQGLPGSVRVVVNQGLKPKPVTALCRKHAWTPYWSLRSACVSRTPSSLCVTNKQLELIQALVFGGFPFLMVIGSGCQYRSSCSLVSPSVCSLGPACVYSSCGPSIGIPLLLAAALVRAMEVEIP